MVFWGQLPGTTPSCLRSLLVLLLSHQFDLQLTREEADSEGESFGKMASFRWVKYDKLPEFTQIATWIQLPGEEFLIRPNKWAADVDTTRHEGDAAELLNSPYFKPQAHQSSAPNFWDIYIYMYMDGIWYYFRLFPAHFFQPFMISSLSAGNLSGQGEFFRGRGGRIRWLFLRLILGKMFLPGGAGNCFQFASCVLFRIIK